ncbi:NADH-quinone oxidoreductase subunit M [Polymorphobacter fuscus]|uniref:NADH-quinone oxidoreductase subunit M n=1 Tax=Sandarakinorhabdus fusca TaxID=1439888 RepID=A0A7C9GSN6_9SPHN|nr:NADH-quinone oxidoreductase subunit M [Polymorphobacter fuscus]KAB7648401.1 NADH-quinone oxidoreductase subunit M [Polymorphobacter fuscus]MQT15918.1 NADH-quinone oxidoreductase subunit M [Polymorphobacter fuscus]NJC07806.1 NADH-quinone oxidoreductase subunit M [Polymorphobacter fuscus]
MILSTMILLPVLVALVLVAMPGIDAVRARVLALVTTLVAFVLGVMLWQGFDNGGPAFQFVENLPLFAPYLAWHVGVDGIALMLIVLSVFLMPLCILASWESVQKRVPEYMAAFLVMESLMIGTFAARDIFLFYVFFEAGLIPMFLIIGIWGGARRIYASYKFFLYTLLGSVLMLVAMLYMVGQVGSTDIGVITAYDFDPGVQFWLFLAFFASFAVKMPMWPVHTWLPDAHVEAPTAGSVILAGVLLKLGGYGFVRFSLPMFPDASAQLIWLVLGLSMVAVVYTSLVALVQNDMKKLIAYSSVAHMAFVTAGLFALNTQGIEGSLVMMLSHGLVSGALFLCVGVVYDRLHTREIARYGGLADTMPRYALLLLFFTMASVGLPATSGFVAEFLVLLGLYQTSTWATFVMTTGIILGAAYMLWLYRRIAFGSAAGDDARAMPDLSVREIAILLPITAAVLWMGIAPRAFQEPMKPAIASIVARLDGRQLATVPTDMTLVPGMPTLVAPAAAAEAHR